MRRVAFVAADHIYDIVRVLPVLVICPVQGSSQDNVEVGRKAARQAAALDGGLSRVERWQETEMARKPTARVEYTLFDVVYEDGSQRSNRRVPSEVLGGLDGDAPARAVIEAQDRAIAERSGTPPLAVKSIYRSGSKKAEEATRSSPRASDR
jgi:hypothetical protein